MLKCNAGCAGGWANECSCNVVLMLVSSSLGSNCYVITALRGRPSRPPRLTRIPGFPISCGGVRLIHPCSYLPTYMYLGT